MRKVAPIFLRSSSLRTKKLYNSTNFKSLRLTYRTQEWATMTLTISILIKMWACFRRPPHTNRIQISAPAMQKPRKGRAANRRWDSWKTGSTQPKKESSNTRMNYKSKLGTIKVLSPSRGWVKLLWQDREFWISTRKFWRKTRSSSTTNK